MSEGARPEEVIRALLDGPNYFTAEQRRECGAALDALVAERDRYRTTLEEIAANSRGDILVAIARAALVEDSGRG